VLVRAAALTALGITASACGSRPEPEPEQPPAVDELEAQLTLARRDSELAAAAAIATPAEIAAALEQVVSERARHARALATEIDRIAQPSTATTSEQTTSATTSSSPPRPAPTLADVVNSLRASATSAGDLATTVSGYRAGLLGSVAAACTAACSVALVFEVS
jgi:hypothetical protein